MSVGGVLFLKMCIRDSPKGVIVENVNLTESLFTLSYLMKENE